jgi:hypothetical protein
MSGKLHTQVYENGAISVNNLPITYVVKYVMYFCTGNEE